jgi:hypothetical protein
LRGPVEVADVEGVAGEVAADEPASLVGPEVDAG